VKIDKLEVGFLATNCYFLIKNQDLIIIDPGADYQKIKEKISNYHLKAIFLTHGHPDHNGVLKKLLNDYDVPVTPDQVKGFNYKIIKTPGHTEDSICFYFSEEKIMFTGDFIFEDAIGRTDLPGGNDQEMKESLEIIKTYPDDTIIYPGHGQKTTLGLEKERFNFYY